jgi:hypothetical protein
MKPSSWERPLPRSNKVRSLKFFHGLLEVSSRANGAAAFLQAIRGVHRRRKASAHEQLKVKLRPTYWLFSAIDVQNHRLFQVFMPAPHHMK